LQKQGVLRFLFVIGGLERRVGIYSFVHCHNWSLSHKLNLI